MNAPPHHSGPAEDAAATGVPPPRSIIDALIQLAESCPRLHVHRYGERRDVPFDVRMAEHARIAANREARLRRRRNR